MIPSSNGSGMHVHRDEARTSRPLPARTMRSGHTCERGRPRHTSFRRSFAGAQSSARAPGPTRSTPSRPDRGPRSPERRPPYVFAFDVLIDRAAAHEPVIRSRTDRGTGTSGVGEVHGCHDRGSRSSPGPGCFAPSRHRSWRRHRRTLRPPGCGVRPRSDLARVKQAASAVLARVNRLDGVVGSQPVMGGEMNQQVSRPAEAPFRDVRQAAVRKSCRAAVDG